LSGSDRYVSASAAGRGPGAGAEPSLGGAQLARRVRIRPIAPKDPLSRCSVNPAPHKACRASRGRWGPFGAHTLAGRPWRKTPNCRGSVSWRDGQGAGSGKTLRLRGHRASRPSRRAGAVVTVRFFRGRGQSRRYFRRRSTRSPASQNRQTSTAASAIVATRMIPIVSSISDASSSLGCIWLCTHTFPSCSPLSRSAASRGSPTTAEGAPSETPVSHYR
jgi:hypothetical protein